MISSAMTRFGGVNVEIIILDSVCEKSGGKLNPGVAILVERSGHVGGISSMSTLRSRSMACCPVTLCSRYGRHEFKQIW